MVSFKVLGEVLAVTCLLALTQADPAKKATVTDRITALYVKDSSNGELRFLGGGITSNAQINQLITQKQDMLEQLRPVTTAGTGNWGTVTGTGTLGGTATGGFGTGTGGVVTGLGGNGVTPIIINAGGGGAGGAVGGGNGGNGAMNDVINSPSPIGALLPQIIAQSVTRGGNRRRGVNNRRRRRPYRGGNKPQIFVVRPRN